MRNLTAVFIASFFLVSCSGKKEISTDAAAAVPVQIEKVHHAEETETISVSGSVVAQGSPSELAFLVSGKVIQAGPREGDFVRKGQVLAVIDPIDYQLALAASQAQSAAARAVLAKAEAPARPEQLEQARISFERTSDEYKRMKMLFDAKSLAPNDFQKIQAAYDSSRQQYEMAQMGAQKEDKAQAKATSDQAEAAEKIARKRLADTTLHSPLDGFVTRRGVEVGDTAAQGRPVYEVVPLNPVEVNVGIPETDIRLVRIGQKATIRILSLPDQKYEGTIRVINVAADPNTRTFMTRITVPNPKQVLRLGMIAEARINGDRKVQIMTVPGEAIVKDPQGAPIVYTYFPDQKRVYAKRVEIGSVYGKEIQIKSGLAGDESVVVGGQNRLRDGLLVEVSSGGRE